jgi:arylsulfatase A-like enzyme
MNIQSAMIFLFGLLSSAGMAAESARTNIVLILMDDMGWHDAGYLGRDYFQTPCIDALAREGMIFTNAYANSPECSPTRACLISGQYTPRHGVYMVRNPTAPDPSKTKLIPPESSLRVSGTLLPKTLKQAGYVTGFFGKWHHQPRPLAGKDGMWDEAYDQNSGEIPPDPAKDPKRMETLTRMAEDFVGRHRDKPFFLYLSHNAPHRPIEAHPETIAEYASKKPHLPADRPDYAAMMENADACVGQAVDCIDGLGLAQRTAIFFFSDNGGLTAFTTNSPLRSGKGSFYEGGLRVPLIVRWTGRVTAGATCDIPVISTDFYPTFLEIAGTDKPANHPLDGVSLLPLLDGQHVYEDRPLYWHMPVYNVFGTKPCSIVRQRNYKLIQWFEDERFELYDLNADISEKHNLIDSQPETAARMRRLLADWQMRIAAPLPQTRSPN